MNKPNRALLASIFQRVSNTQGGFAEAIAKSSKLPTSQQLVQNWLKRESVPAQWVGHIVAASNGAIQAHEIRPDVFPAPE